MLFTLLLIRKDNSAVTFSSVLTCRMPLKIHECDKVKKEYLNEVDDTFRMTSGKDSQPQLGKCYVLDTLQLFNLHNFTNILVPHVQHAINSIKSDSIEHTPWNGMKWNEMKWKKIHHYLFSHSANCENIYVQLRSDDVSPGLSSVTGHQTVAKAQGRAPKLKHTYLDYHQRVNLIRKLQKKTLLQLLLQGGTGHRENENELSTQL